MDGIVVPMSEVEIRDERIRKLEALRSTGAEGYPARSERSMSNARFAEEFAAIEEKHETVVLAGRVMSLRGQGGIVFSDIYDGSARVQVVLQAQGTADIELFQRSVDTGDFIEVSGEPFKTQRGKESLRAHGWKMLAKSLLPMPAEHFGIKDEELRLRERYLDMLLNPELRSMVERRSKFWQVIRQFYLDRGFLEVETPVLETSPGGADARPFITHHNALDIDVFLRISAGELWQKKLLVAGFPKVFEIGRIFRNEGQSREHLQDYTQLESYEAYSDYRAGMTFVQELYRHIVKEVYGRYTFEINGHTVDFAEEWPVADFVELIEQRFGINALTCTEDEAIQTVRDNQIQVGEELNKGRAIDHLWKAERKNISGPMFLTGIPVYLEPLAKRAQGNHERVERVQVILAGSEMGKGFSELNDPQDQRARFEEQQRLRDAGDDEAQRLDEGYVRAMEYGMPPAFGFGVSERLFAFLENKSAHETQLFPLLRPKA